MKFFICCISLLLFSISPLKAQIEKLLNDKDITWVGEIEQDFLLENELNQAYNLNSFNILKILNDENKIIPQNSNDLFSLLKNAAQNNQLELFKDPDLKIRAKKEEIFRIDNSDYAALPNYTFPYYKKEIPTPQDIIGYKFRVIFYYNARTCKFDLYPIAVAPLSTVFFDNKFNFIKQSRILLNKLWQSNTRKENIDSINKAIRSLKPVFWLKLNNQVEVPKLISNNINWAARIIMPKLSEKNFKVIKSLKGNYLIQILEKVKIDSNIVVASGDGELKMLNEKEKKLAFMSHDTIQLIDSSTFEIKLKVISEDLNLSEFKNTQFVMDWFWDRSKNQLIAKLLGVAPIWDIQSGEITYPIFYLLTDKK